MTESTPTSQPARRSSRAAAGPPPRPVTIVFENFKEFIREYSAQISMSGMFIRLDKPHPPGTTLALDLKLGQDFPLIQGTGEVVWTRERAEGPDRPAGVGIRFRDITEQSRDLTYAIVERRMADGGELFRLEGPDETESQELPELQELLESAGKRRLREESQELEPLDSSDAPLTSAGRPPVAPAVAPPAAAPPAAAPPAAAPAAAAAASAAGSLHVDEDLLLDDLPETHLPRQAELPDLDVPDLELSDVTLDDPAEVEPSGLEASASADLAPDQVAAAGLDVDLPPASLQVEPSAPLPSPAPALESDTSLQSAPSLESAAAHGFELDDLPEASLDVPASSQDELSGIEFDLDSDALDLGDTADAGLDASVPREPSAEHPLHGGIGAAAPMQPPIQQPDPPAEVWQGRLETDEEALDSQAPQATSMVSPASSDTPVLEEGVLEEGVLDDPVLEGAVLDDPLLNEGVLDDPVLDAPVLEGAADEGDSIDLDSTYPPPPRDVTDSFPAIDDPYAEPEPPRSNVDLEEMFRVAPSAAGTPEEPAYTPRTTSSVAVSSDDDEKRNLKPVLLAVLVLIVVLAGYYYMALVGMAPDFGLLGSSDDTQVALNDGDSDVATGAGANGAGDSGAGDANAADTRTAAGDTAAGDTAATSTATDNPPTQDARPAQAAPPPAPVTRSPPPPPETSTRSDGPARVLRIEPRTEGGRTRITVVLDAPLGAARVNSARLDSPPRELVRLVGIAEPFGRSSIDVGSSQVRRIRMGYHEKAAGNELHLVIDLASAGARLARVEPNGRQLDIWIEGGSG